MPTGPVRFTKMSYCDWCGFYVENKEADCDMCGKYATRPSGPQTTKVHTPHVPGVEAPADSAPADDDTVDEADDSRSGWRTTIAFAPLGYAMLYAFSYYTNQTLIFGFAALSLVYMYALARDAQFLQGRAEIPWEPSYSLWAFAGLVNILGGGLPSFLFTPYYLWRRQSRTDASAGSAAPKK